MPDRIEGQFQHNEMLPTRDYVFGDAGGPGLNQLVSAINASLEYLKFFVGSTLDEPALSMVSSGGIINISVEKIGGGNIRYRTDEQTKILICDPTPKTVTLTPGTDSNPITNYVYIDHATNDVAVNTIGFPVTPHAALAEYFVRSALFHESNGLLGKEHRNHVFTPGDNGHMGHINEFRRKQPCVFQSGCLLTVAGSGTSDVNFALSSGKLFRVHEHDVSGINAPADFFVSNDEISVDTVYANLNDITTFSEGSDNINKYCIYILYIAHLGTTTGLFLLKPSGGYVVESEAYTDPDGTINSLIPAAYAGSSIYVSRLVARRTATSTTVYLNDTDIRGVNPGSVAGGGLSGVPDHGSTHVADDPIQDATPSQKGLMTASYAEMLELLESRSIVCDEKFGKNLTTLDYWDFVSFNNGRLTRDTTNGGMSYSFDGVAYSGTDGVQTQAFGISDCLAEVDLRLDQDNLYIDLSCCIDDTTPIIGYLFRFQAGSDQVYILKNGTQVANVTLAASISTGTMTASIEKKAGYIRGYINGVEVIQLQDSDYTSGRTSCIFNCSADGAYTGKLNRYTLYRYK